MIRLRVLGQSAIELQRRVVRPEAELVFATLLHLCAERGRRVERESLAELLWPRDTARRRRHSLRQILYKVRRLGVDCSDAAGALCLPASSVWIDFEDEDATRDDGVADELLSPSGVQCLPSYSPRFSKGFAAWVDDFRVRVEGATRRRFASALSHTRARARWTDVEQLARNCLKLDPLNEEATLALAEATAMTGSKSRAIGVLDRYISEVGPAAADLKLPASILRRRIADGLASRRAMGSTVSALVGRQSMITALTSALDIVESGQPAVHALWGPSGIGKTRILEEIAALATLRGVSVACARAAPDDVQTPGLTFIRLIRTMLALPGVLGLAPDVLELLQRLTAQRSTVEPPRNDDVSEDALVRAFADLERALAWESPCVIILDDMQFADHLSQRVIGRAHACMSTERVLLLVSSIPYPGGSWLGKLTAHEVARLDHPATARLAGMLLETAAIHATDQTREAFAVASGGHPFVLREAVAAAAHLGAANPEPTLGGILQQRLGVLSDDARDALLSALVLGEHATVPNLVRSGFSAQSAMENSLTELENEQILSFEPHGKVIAHPLWRDALDRLYPMSRINARRIHLAQLLQQWATESVTGAELLLTSGMLFQRAGDHGRAAAAFSESGAALRKRALPASAYHAYSRAADIAPAAHHFDQWIFQAVRSAHDAELGRELSTLLDTFCQRLRTSPRLSPADAAELDLIDCERLHSLGDSSTGLLDRCALLARSDALEPHQRLRAALTFARIADNNADGESVKAMCSLIRDVPALDRESQRVVRRIALVEAMSAGNLTAACAIAEAEIERSQADSHLARCRALIDARMPFLYDCDFVRVEAVLSAARSALRDYPATRLSVRADDAFATYCIEMLRLNEASAILDRNEAVAQAYGFGPLALVLAETRVRLLLAERKLHPSDRVLADTLAHTSQPAGVRVRVFALCTATIAAARLGDSPCLRRLAVELTAHWDRLRSSRPFDYACLAMAIATLVTDGRAPATAIVQHYFQFQRVAQGRASPFVRALAEEFGFASFLDPSATLHEDHGG